MLCRRNAISSVKHAVFLVSVVAFSLIALFVSAQNGNAFASIALDSSISNSTSTVVFDTYPRDSSMIIDGKLYLPTQLPHEFDWKAGTSHTVILPKTIVQVGEQTREVFSTWDDMNDQTTRVITADRNPASYTAIFNTQFSLRIDTQYGSPTGEGWYNIYDSAHAKVDPVVDITPSNKRVIFSAWSEGENRYATDNSVIMSQPRTLTITWKTQYFANILSQIDTSNISTAKGTGWYDESSQILVSASPQYELVKNNHEFKFSKWVNAGSNKILLENPESPSTLLTVTDSVSLEATYDEYWYLKISSARGDPKGEGYYLTGDIAKVDVTSPSNMVDEQNRLIFSGWKGAVVTNDPHVEIVMDGYKELIALWKQQYYLKTISTYPGLQGAGWYDEGSTARITSDNPQNKWSGDYQGISSEASILMDGPHTLMASTINESGPGSYPILAAVSVAIAAALIFTVRTARRKVIQRN